MKLISLAIAVGLCATAVQADVVNYECELHSMELRGWIPSKMFMSVDAASKKARVYDGAIRSSNELAGRPDEKPADAKFKVTRKSQYQMSWRVRLRANSSRRFRIAYTATLDPQTNAFKVSASFPQANVTNRPSGVGACKPVSSPTLF